MDGDYNVHRTEALLKKTTLAEARKFNLFKVKTSLDNKVLGRVRHINENGISVLKLKAA